MIENKGIFSGVASRFSSAAAKITGTVSDAMPFARASKYGYSNARVSTMKGLLLKKEFFGELTRAGSIDGVIEMLERTYYKDSLTKFSIRHSGSELVQIATSQHFAQIANKLRRITPKSDLPALEVMLAKWDVLNAKIILHARMTGKKYEDVAPFVVPVGSFSEEQAKGLFEGRGESIFLKFAKTELGRKLIASGLVSSAELEKMFLNLGRAEIIKLEIIFDSFYYSLYASSAALSSKDLEPISKIFTKEIDFKNASIIVRLKQHGISDPKAFEKYFIKGGQKHVRSFSALAAATGEKEALKAAAKLFSLKAVPADSLELETMLERTLSKAKINAFYRSILSVGTLLGFLFLKEGEINNLRKIAIGKEFRMPEAKIEEMLIFQD